MARRYTTAQFSTLVDRVRDAMPDVAITADMIVGFPGERAADHAESLAFARMVGFAGVHVFRYSPRRGTAAARMRGQVSPDVKKERSEELRQAVDEMAASYRHRFLGATRSVLWEEELDAELTTGERRWTGLTDNYLRVETLSADDLLGKLSEVCLRDHEGERFRVAL